MKKIFQVFVQLCITGFLLPGCDHGFEQTDSGLWFQFVEKGPGPRPQQGEFLMLDLLIKTQSDSIILSTTQSDIHFPVRYDPYRQKIGLDNILEEGFYMLAMGDSAVFKLPAGKLYGSFLNAVGPMRQEETITAQARVIHIYTYEEYTQWKKKELTLKKERHNQARDKTLQEQIAEIESHLQSQEVKYSGTPSGIRYIITHSGQGEHPEDGDSVSFSYEVTYFDGTKIDGGIGSSGGKPKSILLGAGGVFESWQESIKLLKQGDRGLFYFPSPLAFGASGGYGIKPNSILIVQMELVDVKKNI